MVKNNTVLLRLKKTGSRQKVASLLKQYNDKGESNTLTGVLNKVVEDWINSGRIPPKYRIN